MYRPLINVDFLDGPLFFLCEYQLFKYRITTIQHLIREYMKYRLLLHCFQRYTGWLKKVSHYQIIKKSYYIVLNPVNEITLFVKLMYKSSTVILFVGIRYSMRDLLSDLSNYA